MKTRYDLQEIFDSLPLLETIDISTTNWDTLGEEFERWQRGFPCVVVRQCLDCLKHRNVDLFWTDFMAW